FLALAFGALVFRARAFGFLAVVFFLLAAPFRALAFLAFAFFAGPRFGFFFRVAITISSCACRARPQRRRLDLASPSLSTDPPGGHVLRDAAAGRRAPARSRCGAAHGALERRGPCTASAVCTSESRKDALSSRIHKAAQSLWIRRTRMRSRFSK